MSKRTSQMKAAILALGLLAPAVAQQPQGRRPAAAPSQQQQQDESDVVRITTNLVQVDAVVTDKSGRVVTDLTADDFEVYEEGKKQPITNFSFVAVAPPAGAEGESAAPRPAPRRGDAPSAPTAPLKREQVRRTIALVVDDLRMSHGSTGRVRDGLRKFVREQMQPGDLVAVFRTRGGSSALSQFTSDKALLNKAIDAVRWYPTPLGGTGVDIFEPAEDKSTFKPIRAGEGASPSGEQSFEDERTRKAREANEDRNNDLITYGTFGTLRSIVKGFENAPGRKSVVLFSDDLTVLSRQGQFGRSYDEIERVVDAANRAAAVIYTVDARGLVMPDYISAADDVRPEIQRGGRVEDSPTEKLRQDRIGAWRRSEDGFEVLADATGGRWFHNMNDMDKALERVFQDQTGYYLIGYRPSDETFKGGRQSFRDISIKVKRPGLSVRHRKGFLAVSDEQLRKERAGSSGLYSILASPVSAGELGVRMTANYAVAPAGTAVARLLLHIDGRDVTFSDDAAGQKKLVLDVAAVTLGREGEVIDEFTRTHTVRLGGEAIRVVETNGLTYTADVPVKKPGTYQLRIVVRDAATQRVGSATQVLEVPDLTKKKLSMSGINLREATEGVAGQPAPATAQNALAPVMTPADPAVRRFKPGTILTYNYQVYNATPDPATHRPRLTAQLRLYQNGELVVTGQPTPVDLDAQADPARASIDGAFRVVPNAKPGEYVLQIIVADPLAKDGAQVSQWITFEVER